MATGWAVAVVGCTGAAGQTTLRVLEERKFPIRELRCFASERSVGKTVPFQGEPVPVRRVEAPAFQGLDLVFWSAGSALAREFVPTIRRTGAIVIDKSSAFRLDPEVPLVVPEINPHAARAHRGLLAVPNCTTIVTVMPLKPLHDAGRLRRVVATSFQAASGAGVNGLEDLRQQTLAWARGQAIVPHYFPHQLAFNLIPHIDRFGAGGYTGEELKLVHETRKILELPELAIAPTTVRVPVFTCHSVAVNVETDEKITAERAREVLARFPGLTVWDDPAEQRYPMPVLVEGRDEVWVGRIREDLSHPRALNFWVVGDQLRKGAATNAVQIAELLRA